MTTATTRVFYLASNDYNAINSVFAHLSEGANPLTKPKSINLSRDFAKSAESAKTKNIEKKFLQNARVLWDLFHDPYDPMPSWL